MKKNNKKRLKIVLLSLLALILITIIGFYIYTLDYYKADDTAIQTIATGGSRTEIQGNLTIFYADNIENDTALIFYPGGKVEAAAYTPILMKLAQNGITCVLVKMPFNLAVFNIDAADEIYDKLPNIKHWYICGHSLGGAMASSYVEKNAKRLEGLIMLGAYPINNADIATLAVYGSEDIKLDKTKLEQTKNKLMIQGGNHAYFGNYGEQKGDGTASITWDEQQRQTVQAILDFIKK